MTNEGNAQTVGAKNYTADQEQALIDHANANEGISFKDAGVIAESWGKSPRSIIAKVQSMGLAYIPKAKPAKRPKGRTKADMLQIIADRLSADAASIGGLSKATASSLDALITLLPETAQNES